MKKLKQTNPLVNAIQFLVNVAMPNCDPKFFDWLKTNDSFSA